MIIGSRVVERPTVPAVSPTSGREGTAKTGDVERAGWKKRSEDGREYLSVELDDPNLAQPLNGALVEPSYGEGFILVCRATGASHKPIGRARSARAAPSPRHLW